MKAEGGWAAANLRGKEGGGAERAGRRQQAAAAAAAAAGATRQWRAHACEQRCFPPPRAPGHQVPGIAVLLQSRMGKAGQQPASRRAQSPLMRLQKRRTGSRTSLKCSSARQGTAWSLPHALPPLWP